MITQYKLEYLKRSLYLSKKMKSDHSLRTETEIIDILLTRCALMEEYQRQHDISDQFDDWRKDQNIGIEAYTR
ncbi:hypothetical protein [Leptospira mayottensis]|uniref:Uncharacterized protein n=2 Tax=Leptospira mayottensis TaxID=1137606 RepID=A0AA87SVU6_9LEPT|nr:hypothetical protein [Leptospira mayottensis]AXR64532.1 hypothetical protein DQM28_10165 [Leptospira mayottensis]EKR98397.1 hypothetical protein LEP1GSC125_1861 [Leptospira mayottensis 200901122]